MASRSQAGVKRNRKDEEEGRHPPDDQGGDVAGEMLCMSPKEAEKPNPRPWATGVDPRSFAKQGQTANRQTTPQRGKMGHSNRNQKEGGVHGQCRKTPHRKAQGKKLKRGGVEQARNGRLPEAGRAPGKGVHTARVP